MMNKRYHWEKESRLCTTRNVTVPLSPWGTAPCIRDTYGSSMQLRHGRSAQLKREMPSAFGLQLSSQPVSTVLAVNKDS